MTHRKAIAVKRYESDIWPGSQRFSRLRWNFNRARVEIRKCSFDTAATVRQRGVEACAWFPVELHDDRNARIATCAAGLLDHVGRNLFRRRPVALRASALANQLWAN